MNNVLNPSKQVFQQHVLKLLFVFCLLSFSFSIYAQINVVADVSTARYDVNESMKFEVSSSSSGDVTYEIYYDKRSEVIESGSFYLSGGSSRDISFTLNEPGAVICKVRQNFNSSTAGAMFSPYQIESLESEPDDFDAYWNAAKAELAQVSLSPQLEYYEDNTYSRTYKISLKTVEGRRVYGYIAIPTGEGPFPALLELPAFGSSANAASDPRLLAEEAGAIAMSITIHDAPVGQQDNNAYEPDVITDEDQLYYRLAVLACIRSIDYIFSRDDFDGENMGVIGVSQGGGLSLLTAGIDDRVNLLIQSNAALCEHTGLKYGKASGFPYYIESSRVQDGSASHELQTIAATKYIDAVHAAKRYNGPSMHFISYEDDICPPATVFAAYNNVRGPKVLLHSRELGHSHPGEYWNGRYDFFRKHFPSLETTPNPWASTKTGYHADAGQDLSTALNGSVALNGKVELNGVINNNWQVRWSKISGPGTVSFSNRNSRNTAASFSAEGTYILSFSAEDNNSLASSNKFYTISDELVVTVGEGGTIVQNQTINFPEIADRETTDGPFSINVSASSGLTVALTIVSGPATINGNLITLTGDEGTVQVRARQAGNASFNPAQSVTRSFEVTAPTPPTGGNGGDYCDIKGDEPWQEWIQKVELNSLSNSSGKDGYADYTDKRTTLNQEANYTIKLTTGFSYLTADQYWRVWIDYNQDGDFNDAGETALSQISTAPANGTPRATIEGTISIPATAQLGETRMRVAMRNGGYASSCQNFQLGEVEDYTVEIKESDGGGVVNPPNPNPGDYCDSRGSAPWEEWIQKVRFGSISNSSGKDSYADNTNRNTTVSTGSANTIELTTGFSYFTSDVYWRVWIDYNLDGDFNDADEVAFSQKADAPADGTSSLKTTGTINIPDNALEGETRMRVAMKVGSYPDPCENFNRGEVEDYTVIIDGNGNSGGGDGPTISDGVDLELSIESSSTTITRYENVIYQVQVTNTGNVDAENILIDCEVPSEMAFTRDDVSRGDYIAWTGKWEIDKVDAGETETLELTLFVRQDNNPIKLFAQVEESPQDADSTPDNNNSGNPNEDDEAALVLGFADFSNNTFRVQLNQQKNIVIQNLYPNPVNEELRLSISAKGSASTNVMILDALGSKVHQQSIDLEKGYNRIVLNTSSLGDGVYHILFVSDTLGDHQPIRFIKKSN